MLLLSEDGSRIEGFRAVSGPLTTDTGEIIIRVATEEEYGDSTKEGRRAGMHGMASRDGGGYLCPGTNGSGGEVAGGQTRPYLCRP